MTDCPCGGKITCHSDPDGPDEIFYQNYFQSNIINNKYNITIKEVNGNR